MPRKFMFFCFFISLFIATACDKSNTNPIVDNPQNFGDSITLLQTRWSLVKDSVTNIDGYWYGGWIVPGVYLGTSNDYYDFRDDDSVDINEYQTHGVRSYTLCNNNKLVMRNVGLPDTNTILLLNSSIFIFELRDTSENGGKYYKRVYLKR